MSKNMDETTNNSKEEKNINIDDNKTNKIKDNENNINSMKENNNIQSDDVNKLIQERDLYKDQALRLAAELENYKKRTIREKQEIIEFANERLLLNLLPLIDDLESALDAGKNSSDNQGLLKGIEMIYQKLLKTLEDIGVYTMKNPVGQQFDLELQESLMHIPSENPEGQVLQLVQKGYMYNDKVLRYAKVITSAGKSNLEEKQEN